MWILPKQLHTLDSVRDTEALNLDLNESSQLCSQSLFVRSKHSPLRTWLQKWKRDSWSQHLYGRILKPSLGKAFETEWTSLLEVTHANHSPQQESEQERKTQDTCGLGSQTEFGFSDQESASSRMSRDISRWGCPTLSKTWDAWVTERRGAYSARLKSALLTRGKECSSWPTASTRDHKDSPGMSLTGVNPDGTERKRTDQLARAVYASGLADPDNRSSVGSRQESWATPRTQMVRGGGARGVKHSTLLWGTESKLLDRSNIEEQVANQQGLNDAKLNPRWVETLMGLPVGWVMPSCTRPVIIAPMSCDCLGTESSQPPQNEHLEH
jgi:hypothetical protein